MTARMTVPAYDAARANAPYRAAMLQATLDVLDEGRLILGPPVTRFEQAFARHCGAAHAIGCGNGLDALTLALRALGIGPGDEVVVPAFTFIATWFAVTATGARPIPVDIQQNALIDPARIEAALTPRTRAIIPVHLFGAMADMDAITAIAAPRKLWVVEDAAQAHGANNATGPAGSLGTAAAFSFYPTKNLGALGDAGAVCTNDPNLADRIRRLGNYGSNRKYHHPEIGANSRLDTLQAAYLSLKLPGLEAANTRRCTVAGAYRTALAGLPGLTLPPDTPGAAWHQFVIRTPHRNRLAQALADRGVGTTIHYPAAPFEQPCYAGQYDRTAYPMAATLADTVLSLPMGDYLTPPEIDHVTTSIRACLTPGTVP